MDRGLAEQLLGAAQGRHVLSSMTQRGVSLIEVLIAVAIVGILLGLAAPSAMSWIQNLQVRNAADAVLNGIKTARIEALRRNTSVAFELTDPASTAWHVCLFDTVNATCQAGQPDIAARAASEGSANARVGIETDLTDPAVGLSAGSNVPSLVAFDPLGRISASSPLNIARVDVRNPTMTPSEERRLSVIVSAAGQAYMCDPALVKATNPQGCQ